MRSVPRYRTQEVAGSSPASSITVSGSVQPFRRRGGAHGIVRTASDPRGRAARSASGDFDERGSDCGWDRLACLAKSVEVETDRLADQLLHLVLRVAHDADAGEVGAVGAPGFAFVLDYSLIDSASVALPVEGYSTPCPSARRRPACRPQSPCPVCSDARTADGFHAARPSAIHRLRATE